MTSCVVIATVVENKMASRKAKKEKLVNKTPEVAQVEDQLKEKELIPGKGFYESHWLKLLEKESTDCFIQSLTEEIFETAFAKGYHTLCNTQAFPHSVQWAKAKMIEVIECYFITHDPGQVNIEEDVWTEDVDPPVTAIIDSWARGMMPLQSAGPVHHDHSEKSSLVPTPVPENTVIDTDKVEALTALELASIDDVKTINKEGLNPNDNVLPVSEKKRVRPRPSKKRPIMKVVEKPVPDELVDTLQSQSHSSTLQSHTPPTPTSHLVVPPAIATTTTPLPPPSSPRPAVRSTRGLNAQNFPSQCITPQVKVSQSVKTLMLHEKEQKQQQPKMTGRSVQSRRNHYSHHHHKRHMAKWTTRPDVSTNNASSDQSQQPQSKGGLQRLDSSRYPKRPVLPFLVDLIDPVPGVSVKADGRFLTSPSLVRTKLPSHHGPMKPISSQRLVNPPNGGRIVSDAS